MNIPKFGTLEYYEQQMKKEKLILDALKKKIKEIFQDPNYVPTANELYFFASVMESAETDYSLAEKEFEAKNNELYFTSQESDRNEDY